MADVFICIVIVLCSLVDRLTQIKLTYIWPVESIGFAYGIILSDTYDKVERWIDKGWLKKGIVIFVLCGIVGVVYLKFKYIDFYGDYCLKIILCTLCLLLALLITRRVRFGNDFLAFLGGISYEVYLLHHIVFWFLGNMINNSGVFIWSSIFLTVFLSAAIHMIGESILKKIR